MILPVSTRRSPRPGHGLPRGHAGRGPPAPPTGESINPPRPPGRAMIAAGLASPLPVRHPFGELIDLPPPLRGDGAGAGADHQVRDHEVLPGRARRIADP